MMGITDDPNNPCLKHIQPDGQQACYLVLSEEERRKGFVRPVRRSNVHVGQEVCGNNEIESLIAWNGVSDAPRPKIVVCCQPLGHEGPCFDVFMELEHRLAVRAAEQHVVGGCGSTTTMGQAIAETYARNPIFYSGTMCVKCQKHFPVGPEGEFIWIDDGTRVGT